MHDKALCEKCPEAEKRFKEGHQRTKDACRRCHRHRLLLPPSPPLPPPPSPLPHRHRRRFARLSIRRLANEWAAAVTKCKQNKSKARKPTRKEYFQEITSVR